MNFGIIAFQTSRIADYIAQRMRCEGVLLDGINVIAEKEAAFKDALVRCKNADFLFVIGGLDASGFVKRCVAQEFNLELTVNDKAVSSLEWLVKRNPSCGVSSRITEKLASYPDGFTCYAASSCMTCAASATLNRKEIVLLPDDYADAIRVFDEYIVAVVRRKQSCTLKQFKVYGVEPAEMDMKLSRLKKSRRYSVYTVTDDTSDSLVTFSFTKTADDSLINEVIADFCTLFAGTIYADRDISLAGETVRRLKVRRKRLGIAESLTGGMICSAIVDIAGSSEVFDEGLVTYANESKRRCLGVAQSVLDKYGAVSDETAYEMAVGVIERGNDFALITTGIAGPDGGTAEKPVGLTYIALGSKDGIHVHTKIYSGGRNTVRKRVTADALFYLIGLLG